MPTNYVIKSKMLTQSEINKVISNADKKILKIREIIRNGKNKKEHDSHLYSLIVSARKMNNYWTTEYNIFDKNFTSNDACILCKKCELNCPVNNISVNGKPVWNEKCVACLKCINICPTQAIQYGKTTEGRLRYFNPAIKLSEFK